MGLWFAVALVSCRPTSRPIEPPEPHPAADRSHASDDDRPSSQAHAACEAATSLVAIYYRCGSCGRQAERDGRLSLALDCYTRALECGAPSEGIHWSTLETPERLARANVLQRLGRSEEALRDYRRAEVGVEETTQKQGTEYGALQETIGDLALELGDFATAAAYFARAHAAYADALGWDHPSTARVRTQGTAAMKRLPK